MNMKGVLMWRGVGTTITDSPAGRRDPFGAFPAGTHTYFGVATYAEPERGAPNGEGGRAVAVRARRSRVRLQHVLSY